MVKTTLKKGKTNRRRLTGRQPSNAHLVDAENGLYRDDFFMRCSAQKEKGRTFRKAVPSHADPY